MQIRTAITFVALATAIAMPPSPSRAETLGQGSRSVGVTATSDSIVISITDKDGNRTDVHAYMNPPAPSPHGPPPATSQERNSRTALFWIHSVADALGHVLHDLFTWIWGHKAISAALLGIKRANRRRDEPLEAEIAKGAVH